MSEPANDPGEQERLLPIREGLDRVDAELVRLLGERRRLSAEMIRRKDAAGKPLRDQKREEEMLTRRIQAGREAGLDAHYLTRIFHEIIEDSIRLQQDFLLRKGVAGQGSIRVAFQGIEGAYSHLASKQFFAKEADRLVVVGLPSFQEVIRAVEDGAADYAMLPVENTTAGSVNEVVDLLYHTRLSVIGEEKLRVDHCLVAHADVPLESLRKVFSHPQALAQCSVFLAGLPGCKVEYFTDTAMAVKRIQEDRDPSEAAVASEEAARLYGLTVLRRGIANQRDNFTRFFVAAAQARPVDLRIPAKTSIMMAVSDKPGALLAALLPFREHQVNLTKLESRPILGTPWEYFFFVDLEGNLDEPRVGSALAELTREARFLKVLGCYPAKDLARTEPDPRAVAMPEGPAAASAAATVAPAAAPRGASPPARKGYHLASRDHKSEDSVIIVKGVKIGGDGFVVIAGPGAVESREQILACARTARERGAKILRGGCFKPRSSPYGFPGLGWAGLELLRAAGDELSLPIACEVMSPGDVPRMAGLVDLLQIGARNLQDPALLGEAGRVNRPVILERGHLTSIEELLHAAEHVLSKGNQQVILCEGGIRTFETATRSTLDIAAVPALRSLTHLPVLVDPSRAAGERRWVPPLARAAKAAGAQGIVIEIHPDPEKALSEGPQALAFPAFAQLMGELFGK